MAEIKVIEVPVTQIEPNPHQPRERFTEEALRELGNSIREKGILQPITLRATENGRYELISGERRWRACKLIERDTIPAIVMDVLDDKKVIEMAFIENIQRENLTPLEEARALAGLQESYNGNRSQVAHSLGKTMIFVSERLALLELTEEVQKMLDRGLLNLKQAKILLEIKDPKAQLNAAKLAARLQLNADQLKARTQHLTTKTFSKSSKKVTQKTIASLLIRLYEMLGQMDPAQFNSEVRQTLIGQIDTLAEGLSKAKESLGEIQR